MKAIFSIAIVGLALISFGCCTSPEFQTASHLVAHQIALHAKTYAAGDPVKTQQADTLDQDTNLVKQISRPKVTKDWAAIKAWYNAGATAERDANEQAARIDLGKALDNLIAADESRTFKICPASDAQ